MGATTTYTVTVNGWNHGNHDIYESVDTDDPAEAMVTAWRWAEEHDDVATVTIHENATRRMAKVEQA